MGNGSRCGILPAGLATFRPQRPAIVWQSEKVAVSAQAGVNLGIGDEECLLGDGKAGCFVFVCATAAPSVGRGLIWHAQLGYLRAGWLRILGSIQERGLRFAGLGVEWPIWRNLTSRSIGVD